MSTAPEVVAFFASLIERETGIQYGPVNQHLLENRLRELARTLGFADVAALWAEVRSRGLRGVERDTILDLATNNETSFFRDPEVFEFFKNVFVPQCTTSSRAIKIWSAACSTGQEPYSLAIALDELARTGVARSYDLFATDISERVLSQARQGLYSQLEIQRGLAAALLVRYFEQTAVDGSSAPKFRVKPELKRDIAFHRLNLLDPWSNQGPFDIVFCRNVLIYQDVEGKKKIIKRMAGTLAPGGYLVLGGAESLLGLSSDFDMQLHGKACVYRIKASVKASA